MKPVRNVLFRKQAKVKVAYTLVNSKLENHFFPFKIGFVDLSMELDIDEIDTVVHTGKSKGCCCKWLPPNLLLSGYAV